MGLATETCTRWGCPACLPWAPLGLLGGAWEEREEEALWARITRHSFPAASRRLTRSGLETCRPARASIHSGLPFLVSSPAASAASAETHLPSGRLFTRTLRSWAATMTPTSEMALCRRRRRVCYAAFAKRHT